VGPDTPITREERSTNTRTVVTADFSQQSKIYQMDYMEGWITDNSTQTIDIDPTRDEELKGMDIANMA
jgi:hypothetical protein